MSIGDLKTVPYFYDYYQCIRCKNPGKLSQAIICSCGKSTKYKSTKVLVNNIKFDSLSEGRRYSKLVYLFNIGQISEVELQPAFKVVISKKHVFTYKADFRYSYQNKIFVDDEKGNLTAVFKLKLKIIKALNPELIINLTKTTR
jgi:hypothetical protein